MREPARLLVSVGCVGRIRNQGSYPVAQMPVGQARLEQLRSFGSPERSVLVPIPGFQVEQAAGVCPPPAKAKLASFR